MRFVSIYTPSAQSGGPPSQEHIARMGALIEKMMAEGSLKFTAPLGRSERGVRVCQSNGNVEIANGPFPESTFAKASGFAVLEAATHEDMIRFTKEFLAIAGDGVSEIIPLADIPPPA